MIAPTFPSNTARSGVLYPFALSVAESAGVTPEREDRRRLGRFLMFSGMASLTLSSVWLTAMAGNPLGAEMASRFGVEIGFGSCLVAAVVPTVLAIALTPAMVALWRAAGGGIVERLEGMPSVAAAGQAAERRHRCILRARRSL